LYKFVKIKKLGVTEFIGNTVVRGRDFLKEWGTRRGLMAEGRLRAQPN
jgi:hypothetical protein